MSLPLEPLQHGVTKDAKDTINRIHKDNSEMVKYWQTIADEAKKQLEYWKRQEEASSIISTRITLQLPPQKERER